MSRLSALYQDMHAMLTSVLRPTHPIMIELKSPLSPTSSPLRSARNFLHEVLDQLRKMCAPARNPEVDAMLGALLSPQSENDLPSVIVETVRSIFKLVKEMTDDLHNFTLSNLTETDIVMMVTLEAHRREYELILRLYGGLTGVRRTWDQWLSPSSISDDTGNSNARVWRRRLVASLSMPSPISIAPPPLTELPPEVGSTPATGESEDPLAQPAPNVLPALFLISSPALFRIQNLLQSLVITSSLRLLAYPSANASFGPVTPHGDAAELFTSRIWSLLVGEVDRGGFAPAETKLVNFEDEVWDAIRRQRASTPTSTSSLSLDEATVRANVQRLLRTADPVFTLLMRRVTNALAEWVESCEQETTGNTSDSTAPSTPTSIPGHMQTGRRRQGISVRVNPPDVASTGDRGGYPNRKWDPHNVPSVKTMESQTLRQGVEDVASQLATVMEWAEITWIDVINPRPEA